MSAKKNSKNNLKNRIQTRSDVHKQLISGEDENTSTEEEEEINVNRNVNENVNVYKKRKDKFEDRYVRQTFYIEKNLLSKLNQVSEEKGDKTRIINEALQKHLEE